ncbi:ribosome 60S biogenesis N-terminal-domain-containing protein [Gorgonomyces haynaldii]|nr:ribosome 60S biogenesis N-terminal-domain-containing protein [Gorgonomyces haynaldii]
MLFDTQHLGILEQQLQEFKKKSVETIDQVDSSFMTQFLKESELGLFQVWDIQNQHDAGLEILVVECLANTITASKVIGMRASGTVICQKIIRECLPQIYRYLSHQKHSLVQSTLKLLLCICQHQTSTNRELAKQFDFTLKALGSFLRIRRTAEDGHFVYDIRTAYIKFLLSFFKTDSSIKKYLLELKNILVELVLETFKRGILDDQELGKNVKLHFFGQKTLENLIKLYDVESQIAKEPNGTRTVQDLADQFFVNLSHTLRFNDNGWYPNFESKEINNRFILRLCLLLQPNKIRQRMLLLRLLEGCPEAVHPYLLNTKLSYEPKDTIQFIANVSLISSIIQMKIPEKFGNPDAIIAPPMETVLSNILPSLFSRNVSTRSLQVKSRDGRYAAVQLLNTCFRKLEQVLLVRPEFTNFNQQLLLEYRHLLPDVQTVIQLFSKFDISEPTDSVDLQEFKAACYRLLSYYQQFHTQHVMESKFDITKIIPELEELSDELIHEILNCLLTAIDFRIMQKRGLSKIFRLYKRKPIPLAAQVLEKSVDVGFLGVPDLFEFLLHFFSRLPDELFEFSLLTLETMLQSFTKSPLELMNQVNQMEQDLLFPPFLLLLLKQQNDPLVIGLSFEILTMTSKQAVLQFVSILGSDSRGQRIKESLFKVDASIDIQTPELKPKKLLKLAKEDPNVLFQHSFMTFKGKWDLLDQNDPFVRYYLGLCPCDPVDGLFDSWMLCHARDQLKLNQNVFVCRHLLFWLECSQDPGLLDHLEPFLQSHPTLVLSHPSLLSLFGKRVCELVNLYGSRELAQPFVQKMMSQPQKETLELLYDFMNDQERCFLLNASLDQPDLLCILIKRPLTISRDLALKLLHQRTSSILEFLEQSKIDNGYYIDFYATITDLSNYLDDFETIKRIIPKNLNCCLQYLNYLKEQKPPVELLLETWQLIKHFFYGNDWLDCDRKLIRKVFKRVQKKANEIVSAQMQGKSKFVPVDPHLIEFEPQVVDNCEMEPLMYYTTISQKKEMMHLVLEKIIQMTQELRKDPRLRSQLLKYVDQVTKWNIQTDNVQSFLKHLFEVGFSNVQVLQLGISVFAQKRSFAGQFLQWMTNLKSFNKIMQDVSHPSRYYFFMLLKSICQQDILGCQFIVPQLAKNYSGTLQRSETVCLMILRLFEQQSSVARYLYQWTNESTVFQPSDALNPIDPQIMQQSIQQFPLERDVARVEEMDIPIYDPCFILPLLAGLCKFYKEQVDPRKLIECLGIPILALSSHSLNTRRAGHLILGLAYQIIDDSEVKERNQVLLLLSGFRDGIQSGFDPVPSLITQFTAQALLICTRPESDLFPIVNQFLLQRPIMDHTDDYHIFQRRHIFYRASLIPSVISSAITQSGLLSFFKSHKCHPLLIYQAFRGFQEAPNEWDSTLTRREWLMQFYDLLQNMKPTTPGHIYIVLRFSADLAQAFEDPVRFHILHLIKQLPDLNLQPTVLSIQHLESQFVPGYDQVQEAIADLICNMDISTLPQLQESMDLMTISKQWLRKLIRLVLEKQELIQAFKSTPSYKLLIGQVCNALDTSLGPFARALLILLFKHDHHKILNQWAHLTPSPMYLLKNEPPLESFVSKRLNQILKDIISQ